MPSPEAREARAEALATVHHSDRVVQRLAIALAIAAAAAIAVILAVTVSTNRRVERIARDAREASEVNRLLLEDSRRRDRSRDSVVAAAVAQIRASLHDDIVNHERSAVVGHQALLDALARHTRTPATRLATPPDSSPTTATAEPRRSTVTAPPATTTTTVCTRACKRRNP